MRAVAQVFVINTTYLDKISKHFENYFHFCKSNKH